MWLEAQQADKVEELTQRERDVAAKELINCIELVSIKDTALAVGVDKLALCEQRVSLMKEESETYKRLYDSVRKKGVCWKRFFTFGLKGCK